jgi:proline dehydrogenase
MDQNLASPPKTIFDAIPLSLVMRLAAPYLAGESASDAIRLAHEIHSRDRFSSNIDILGEDSVVDDDCDRIVQAYIKLIDTIRANPIKCDRAREQMTVSMKPSMFSTVAPQPGKASELALEKAFDRISRVVDYGLKHDIAMTLEAEDHRWTNFHLEAYFALVSAGYTNLGTVLQSRLFRTEKDVKRFDNRMRVRLVIGIYNEPDQIAHTDKGIMKDLLVQYAGQLLEAGSYVEIASHDTKCIQSFYGRVVIPNTVPSHMFEHQFLLGVPRSKVQKGLISGSYFQDLAQKMPAAAKAHLETLANEGGLVRMYLPYGTAQVAGAYCRRRLRENPNMITYGIKNVFGIQ